MARPRRYASRAEQQAAYRARQAEVDAAARAEQIAHDLELAATRAEIERTGLTEEAYVAREVEVTRQQLAAGQLKDLDAEGNPLDRLARSERYARWRWRGVQDGSIAAL